MPARDAFDLLDWKRRVFALYDAVRSDLDHAAAWRRWRRTRDELFSTHPQSPLSSDKRSSFTSLPYFDYDPAFRARARVEPAAPERFEIPTSGNESFAFSRIGTARFALADADLSLDVFWLEGYGGGLFVPFRDETSGVDSYGAGRYLLDTVKGADLGGDADGLVFDFNFAYNPSCAYDPRWVCPLAPPGNRLDVEVRAGERYDD